MWNCRAPGEHARRPGPDGIGLGPRDAEAVEVFPCQTAVPSGPVTTGSIQGLGEPEKVQSVVSDPFMLRKSIVRLLAAAELGLTRSQLCMVSTARPMLVASRPKARSLMWRR